MVVGQALEVIRTFGHSCRQAGDHLGRMTHEGLGIWRPDHPRRGPADRAPGQCYGQVQRG